MSKRTTTKQLLEAITSNLLQITKAEIYYKDSGKTDIITDSFFENLQFFCESGCFVDAVGWHYELNYKTGSYEFEIGRLNPESELIITAYFNVCDDANVGELKRMLLFAEEE